MKKALLYCVLFLSFLHGMDSENPLESLKEKVKVSRETSDAALRGLDAVYEQEGKSNDSLIYLQKFSQWVQDYFVPLQELEHQLKIRMLIQEKKELESRIGHEVANDLINLDAAPYPPKIIYLATPASNQIEREPQTKKRKKGRKKRYY